MLLKEQNWECELLFNEADPNSKLPQIVNIMDTLKLGNPYILPERFHGVQSKKQVKIELKLAALQAGFTLSPRTTKKTSKLMEGNGQFSSYLRLECTKRTVYKKNKKEHDNIRGDYKTRTKCSKDSDHRCTFALNVACRKIDSRWIIRPLPIARQR